MSGYSIEYFCLSMFATAAALARMGCRRDARLTLQAIGAAKAGERNKGVYRSVYQCEVEYARAHATR